MVPNNKTVRRGLLSSPGHLASNRSARVILERMSIGEERARLVEAICTHCDSMTLSWKGTDVTDFVLLLYNYNERNQATTDKAGGTSRTHDEHPLVERAR